MGFQNCVILILPRIGAPHTYRVSITVVESVTFVTYALLAYRFVAFVDLNKIMLLMIFGKQIICVVILRNLVLRSLCSPSCGVYTNYSL